MSWRVYGCSRHERIATVHCSPSCATNVVLCSWSCRMYCLATTYTWPLHKRCVHWASIKHWVYGPAYFVYGLLEIMTLYTIRVSVFRSCNTKYVKGRSERSSGCACRLLVACDATIYDWCRVSRRARVAHTIDVLQDERFVDSQCVTIPAILCARTHAGGWWSAFTSRACD
jgi:hypothetical protein